MTPDRDAILDQLARDVAPFTMVDVPGLLFTWKSVLRLIEAGVPGVVVECGTWLGGCSLGIALAQRRIFGTVLRPVYMLDSFEGLPIATDRDGPAALQYQANANDPGYLDNCRAPLDRVLATRANFDLGDAECPIVKGWFSDTVPTLVPALQAQQGIALLRIDCDWYDPVRLVLDAYVPLVAEHGLVILDDYYAWDGCARATHQWLAASDVAYRLRQGGAGLPWAWFEKRAARDYKGQL